MLFERLKEKLKARLCWGRRVYTGCERRLKAGDRLEDGEGAWAWCGARQRCTHGSVVVSEGSILAANTRCDEIKDAAGEYTRRQMEMRSFP